MEVKSITIFENECQSLLELEIFKDILKGVFFFHAPLIIALNFATFPSVY